MTTMNEEAACV